MRSLCGRLAYLCFSASIAAFPYLVHAQSLGQRCRADLNAIPSFLLAHDAGAKDNLLQRGQPAIDAAFARAREKAAVALDPNACVVAIREYLRAWRAGHLGIQDIASVSAGGDSKGDSTPLAPSVRWLSNRTVLLTIPSFGNQYREPLKQLLRDNRRALAAHANWIIDVRDNDGGSDSTYAALLPWLMPDQRVEVSADWFVTPENIRAQERACPIFAPGDKACEESSANALARMRGAPIDTFVSQDPAGEMEFVRESPLEPRRPKRVAVLIDRKCKSSCEEFLLTVRQSFNVKLVGRRTSGSLDYSNLRPYDLPSGERRLFYAISRSRRLPDLPVDAAGVPPDVLLAAPADARERDDAVVRVGRWLEGGSLAPTVHGL